MSRAQDIAAKAARLRAQQQPKPETPQVTTDVSKSVPTDIPPAVRVKPIRSTLDLPPNEHADLQRHALETAAALGVARVNGMEIMRELVRLYLADPATRSEVTRRIRDQRAKR